MATPKVPTYQPHQTHITFNDDQDLIPIIYKLPEPPNYKRIEGYGKKPEDQFWQHKRLPHKLAKLQSMIKDEQGNRLSPRQKVLLIEKDPDYYAEEIIFIQQEWDRRENGHWFFNNGVPTYITGDHYFYLQWWTIDGKPPDYRYRDRSWFLFWKMCEDDDLCFGFNNPKQRREGATIKVCSIRWGHAAMYEWFTTGLQSKDYDHAREVHEINLYDVAKRVPFFFQPVTNNSQNEISTIDFKTPVSLSNPDCGEPALESMIDYRDSGVYAYDGYKRWLIHNDEVGKTEIDINERIAVQLPILTNIQKNSERKGKMINTSTVGQMSTGGGGNFKKLCDASDYHKRNANGMTTSGLYTLFQGVKEGMEGIDFATKKPFINKYGNPESELIEQFCTNTREGLRMAGNIAEYIAECQKFPIRYSDCWKTSARACPFNLLTLEDRLEHFRNGNELKQKGFFAWKGDKVEWHPSESGHAFLSWNFPDPIMSNRMVIDEDGNKIPANKNKFIAGGDPYRLAKTKRKGSDGGGAIFMKYNHGMDAGKETKDWESHRFIYTYRHRPKTLEDFYEDQLMACVYFGCQMDWEINVQGGPKYFADRGYGAYNYYKFDTKKGKFDTDAGSTTTIQEVNDIFRATQLYIEYHAHRECHDELLREWKAMEDNLSDFDLGVAAGKCLLRKDDDVYSIDDEKVEEVKITDYFRRFSYDNKISV